MTKIQSKVATLRLRVRYVDTKLSYNLHAICQLRHLKSSMIILWLHMILHITLIKTNNTPFNKQIPEYTCIMAHLGVK